MSLSADEIYEQAESAASQTGIDPAIIATIAQTESDLGDAPPFTLGIGVNAAGAGAGSSGQVLGSGTPNAAAIGQPPSFYGYNTGAEASAAFANYLQTWQPALVALASNAQAFFTSQALLNSNYYVPMSGGESAAAYYARWASMAAAFGGFSGVPVVGGVLNALGNPPAGLLIAGAGVALALVLLGGWLMPSGLSVKKAVTWRRPDKDVIALSLLTLGEAAHGYSSFCPSSFTIKTLAVGGAGDTSGLSVDDKIDNLRSGYVPATLFAVLVGGVVSIVAEHPLPLMMSVATAGVMLVSYESALPSQRRYRGRLGAGSGSGNPPQTQNPAQPSNNPGYGAPASRVQRVADWAPDAASFGGAMAEEMMI